MTNKPKGTVSLPHPPALLRCKSSLASVFLAKTRSPTVPPWSDVFRLRLDYCWVFSFFGLHCYNYPWSGWDTTPRRDLVNHFRFTLQATLPGMVQYKRPALEKSGLPVYQPTATAAAAAAYQQAALALQMQQQFAVPVSCKYLVDFRMRMLPPMVMR